MSLIEITDHRGNPLEVVERMASTNDWSFERAGEDEITILVRGKWTDYQVSFTWMDDIEAQALGGGGTSRILIDDVGLRGADVPGGPLLSSRLSEQGRRCAGTRSRQCASDGFGEILRRVIPRQPN